MISFLKIVPNAVVVENRNDVLSAVINGAADFQTFTTECLISVVFCACVVFAGGVEHNYEVIVG